MKKRFTLILSALTLICSGAMGATYYGFKIGGVEVNSNNYKNVTGSNIKSGTVRYDPDKKTVYLKDVTIERTGKDNRAILNESNHGMVVVFEGVNYLSARDAAPVRINANTYITCANGGKAIIVGDKEDAICPYGSGGSVSIYDANLEVYAYNSRAFEGNNVGDVAIRNSTIKVQGRYGAFSRLRTLYLGGNTTDITMIGNSTAVTINEVEEFDVNRTSYQGTGRGTCFVNSENVRFDSSKKAIVTNSEPSGYTGDLYVASEALEFTWHNFPDNTFCAALADFDENGDGYLDYQERNKVTIIDVYNKGISNLKGIENFHNLKSLACGMNNLSTLDVSKNTNLEYLECIYNNLSTLDVSKNTNLKTLYCTYNNLSTLDVSKNTNLETLYCEGNNLSTLDVSKNTKIVRLNVCYNKLTTTALQSLVNSLPTVSSGSFYPLCFVNNESNALITKTQVEQAKAKGWNTYYRVEHDWELYPGYDDTAVESIKADAATFDGPRYNLKGQRVGRDYKGVVIVQGRKFVQ